MGCGAEDSPVRNLVGAGYQELGGRGGEIARMGTLGG